MKFWSEHRHQIRKNVTIVWHPDGLVQLASIIVLGLALSGCVQEIITIGGAAICQKTTGQNCGFN